MAAEARRQKCYPRPMRLTAPVLAAAAWALCAAGAWRLERGPASGPWPAQLLYGQGSEEDEGSTSGQSYQRLRAAGDAYQAEYGFINFNRDRVVVTFQLKKGAFASYDASHGYFKRDLDGLRAAHEAARQKAYQEVVRLRRGQAQLDSEMARLKADYDAKVKAYLASKGFRLMAGNVLTIDMPLLVKRNAPLLKSLAMSFEQISTQRHYDSDSLIGAVASMAQTALIYRVPPPLDGERHTGGLLPPATALVKGWGDCDTKTGLIASILANWPHMRMVGLAVPGHYLMGVLRIPNKGDVFVEHEGLQYVLIESAGPAWLAPGTVSPDTLALLEAPQGYRLEPFF